MRKAADWQPRSCSESLNCGFHHGMNLPPWRTETPARSLIHCVRLTFELIEQSRGLIKCRHEKDTTLILVRSRGFAWHKPTRESCGSGSPRPTCCRSCRGDFETQGRQSTLYERQSTASA